MSGSCRPRRCQHSDRSDTTRRPDWIPAGRLTVRRPRRPHALNTTKSPGLGGLTPVSTRPSGPTPTFMNRFTDCGTRGRCRGARSLCDSCRRSSRVHPARCRADRGAHRAAQSAGHSRLRYRQRVAGSVVWLVWKGSPGQQGHSSPRPACAWPTDARRGSRN